MPDPNDSDPLAELLSQEYDLTGRVSRLAGESDNFLVETGDERFVLKLCTDAQTPEVVELEHLAVESVADSNLGLELPRIVPTRGGAVEAKLRKGGTALRGRLLRFVDGVAWSEAGMANGKRRRDVGRRLAEIGSALATVDVPASRRSHRWDLTAAADHRDGVALVKDASRRRMLDQAFVLFVGCAQPFLPELAHGLIHGDLNDENVLVRGDQVTGVLDFGDCLHNPVVCELAIALAYLLLDEPEPLEAGAEIVAAYNELRPLSTREAEVLFPLICGRLAASVVIAAKRRRIDPERSAWYVTEERAWRALETYVRIDPITAAEQLASVAKIDVYADRSAAREPMLVRRQRHACDAMSLSYQEPLKIARGRGQFLFDERERPYLDLYNNVCHVGHCHPRVVEAGARQMARLNTNTRYLYDDLVEYSERLCATLPAELQVCFFVNSGSEANELAIRLARTHTGHRDLLVVDNAYHGHTTTMVDISPYKFMGRGGAGKAEDWVHVVPVADSYRGQFRGHDRATGIAYGEEVGKIIGAIERPIAGFITESLLSCGGQVIPPPGYFETAFAYVRRAGGVCIVDEVQVGFGRVGSHFWGFELQEVVPDIVVMGKPIGNGHPMSAVVTTREIADSMAASGMEFFATFGGNPVSCAIGRAVLDVIRDEGLQEHAARVGTHFRDELRGLMSRYELIGDVRGVGLFIGVELVRDRSTLEPATEEASQLVNALRQRGILTGTDGPHNNVVKIKPPMVITRADADLVVRAFDEILGEMAA